MIHVKDQDSTDFQKCLNEIHSRFNANTHNPLPLKPIAVLGGVGGRLDHSLAHIHTLFEHASRQIYLISEESLAFLLEPNTEHVIYSDSLLLGPTCGLLPIGINQAKVKTQGLKWDLGEFPLSLKISL